MDYNGFFFMPSSEDGRITIGFNPTNFSVGSYQIMDILEKSARTWNRLVAVKLIRDVETIPGINMVGNTTHGVYHYEIKFSKPVAISTLAGFILLLDGGLVDGVIR